MRQPEWKPSTPRSWPRWPGSTATPIPARNSPSWKKITFNDFHDLAAGSGIAVIYRDAQKDFHQVFNDDHAIDSASLQTLNARVDTSAKTGVPVIIYNTLAWPRSEPSPSTSSSPKPPTPSPSTDAKGALIPTQITNHIAGTNDFEVLADIPTSPPSATPSCMRTPASNHAAATADLTADSTPPPSPSPTRSSISSSTRRRAASPASSPTNTEYLAPHACGNQLQTFTDTPKDYDAWNIDPGTLDRPMTPIDHVDSIVLTDNGPLRKTIRITRTWSKSHFIQDISLDANSDVVRVSTTVEWHETHVLLKAAFPLAATSAKATYEIPYGNIERTTTPHQLLGESPV